MVLLAKTQPRRFKKSIFENIPAGYYGVRTVYAKLRAKRATYMQNRERSEPRICAGAAIAKRLREARRPLGPRHGRRSRPFGELITIYNACLIMILIMPLFIHYSFY